MRSNQLFKVICLCVLFGLGQTGCLKDDGETIALPSPLSVEGIPSDYSASPNPTIVSPNAAIPNFQVETTSDQGSLMVARLDMTGIMNPNTHEWIDLYGTSYENQNIWMSLDGTPKGIMVKNHTDDETVSRKFDLVFLVDNSGSMNQESDALARDIIDWANSLENSNIDIKFGCIGYAEDGYVNGAIDFTSQTGLSAFLNYESGTLRTQHFGGNNATILKNYARNYGEVRDECGVMALRFANDYLAFREGSNRIYVNFTDEPNQPNNNSQWSVEYLNPSAGNWSPQQGTVHTVYSGDHGYENYIGSSEQPWLMSEYTGGTVLYAASNFSGVSLYDLPVTGAMQHSCSIYFTVPKTIIDGLTHLMKISVLSPDNAIRAERQYTIRFE